MEEDGQPRRLMPTKQDITDFLFAVTLSSGLDLLVSPEERFVGGTQIALRGVVWGGMYGMVRGYHAERKTGIRSGIAFGAGTVVGQVGAYLIKNYQLFT